MGGVEWGCMGHYFEWVWDVWGIILDGWGWVEKYFGWMGVGGDEWGCVGWVGVSGGGCTV